MANEIKVEQDVEKANKFMTFLLQPSTIKGIGTAVGLFGYAIKPEWVAQITALWGIFYSAVSIFYDKN